MKARHIIITLAAIALVAVPGFLLADGPFGGPGEGRGGPGGGMHGGKGLGMFERMLPRLVDYLDLSEDQQAQIEAVLDDELPAIRAWQEQAHDARQAFRDSHSPGDFDEQEFRAFAESQSQLHVEIAVASARGMSRIWNVLTPEQQEKLEDLRGMFGRHEGPRRGGGRVNP